MAYYKKTIVAGPLVMESVYPAPNPRDPTQIRREKQKLSSAALQRMNLKYAYQKLELLIAANFKPGDIWAVLTYTDEALPKTRKQAIACVGLFAKNLRAIRKAKNKELLYLYNVESKHFAEDYFHCGRYHHHIFINSTGKDLDDIRQAWSYGKVLFKIFKLDREHTYESAARYMVKEQKEYVGDRAWSGSRNLKKPEVDRVSVPDRVDIDIPQPAVVYSDTQTATWYGRYRHVKYLLPSDVRRAPRASRRQTKPKPQRRQPVRINRRI